MKVLGAFLTLQLLTSVAAQAACTSMQLSFADGSQACLESFEPLNLDVGPNIAKLASTKRTFSYAIPADRPQCPAGAGWAWNYGNGQDEKHAVANCERIANEKAKAAGLSEAGHCHCRVMIPSNGHVDLSQRDFVSAIFTNAYGVIDEMPDALNLGELRVELQRNEEAHYRRLNKP